MFKFFKKKDRLNKKVYDLCEEKDYLGEKVYDLCGDFILAGRKRMDAVKTLVQNRKNTGFYKMTQAVFDDAYDLIDFETVSNKYIAYFVDKTSLSEEEIMNLLKDIYDAGRENKITNEKIDTFEHDIRS